MASDRCSSGASTFPQISLFILLLGLVPWTIAGPIANNLQTNVCVIQCHSNANPKFQYEVGAVYIYDFTSDLQTSVLNDISQRSALKLSTKAEIHIESACEFTLTLHDVKIMDGDEKTLGFPDIEKSLQAHPVTFSFQDGNIDHICPHPDEPLWVTNVKRGILSMFQNTKMDLEKAKVVNELDINGMCPTEYKLGEDGWGGSKNIVKTKNLTSCANRKHYFSSIQSVPNFSSTETNLLTGKVECVQTILQGQIERVRCQEEQIFKPFDQHDSGAKNVIIQSLKLIDTIRTKTINKGNLPKETRRVSLMYETDTISSFTTDDIMRALRILELLKTQTSNSQKNAPILFRELIESLGTVTESGLKSLLARVKGDPVEVVLINALALVKTAPALTLMTEFYEQRSLGSDVIEAWLSNIAFIKDPSKDMVTSLMPLLTNTSSTNVLFSVSSLLNSYCKGNMHCATDKLILNALQTITSPLRDSCSQSHDAAEIRNIVVALKAVGNMGVGEASAISLLEQCFKEKVNAINIRLAAVNAYRRMPCSSFALDQILKVYADFNENTEVRVQAYLTAMKCANRQVLEIVEAVLSEEVVNQVGSFVWTHLTNLQETTRPEKLAIRNLLANKQLLNKFKTDARKFSRNYETSYFSDSYGLGAGLDANVIFTEESFLPKSAMANISIQMFGETINLLELGTRFTSPETLLEPIFGPKGYFPDDSMATFLKNARQKRDVSSSKIPRLDVIHDLTTSGINEEPRGEIYTRMFGHEVMFKDFKVSTEGVIPNVIDEHGKKWFSMKAILDNLSTGKRSQFTRSNTFMDIDYSIPTIAGLPLTLSFQGGSTFGLTAEGRFNVGKYMEKKEIELYGLLQPNVVLNLDASLTVGLGPRNNFIKSGMIVRNVLHSSTGIETELQVSGVNKVKMTVNLPQTRQDIFEASSKVVFLQPSGKEEILSSLSPDIPQLEFDTCFGDKNTNFLGLEMCGRISIPKRFTLTPLKPAIVSLHIEKSDQFPGYTVDYSLEKSPIKNKLSVVFDTPGSQVDRKIALLFERKHTGSFQAFIKAPGKLLQTNGTYSEAEKTLDIKLLDSGQQLLIVNASIIKTPTKIRPYFFMALYQKPLVEFHGIIDTSSSDQLSKKTKVDVTVKHLTVNPVKLQGSYTEQQEGSEISLGIESFYVTGTLVSKMKTRFNYWSSRSTLEYSWKQGEVNNVDISVKIQKNQRGTLSRYSAIAGLVMSAYPDHSIDFQWETTASTSFCENIVKLIVGKSTWDAHTLYSLQNTRDLTEVRILLSLLNPRNNIDYLLEFGHRVVDRSFDTKFVSRVGPLNEVKARVSYDSQSKPFSSNNLTAELNWPGNEYYLQGSLVEKKKGEYDGELMINPNKVRDMKATISYINNSTNLKLDHLLEFRARGFFAVPVSGNLGFSITDKQSHIGCQLVLEGKKPYSSRLSTSIDYTHIRNMHKVEAKVTYNEKKYSSELIYTLTKSGAKHLLLDLQLDKRIHIDGKISGMLPDPIMISLSLVPDQDNLPADKLDIAGSISNKNLSLNVNYFGKKVNALGTKDDTGVKGEIGWGPDQKISAAIKMPNMKLENVELSAEVMTPFEGWKNIQLQGINKLNASGGTFMLSGQIDEKSLNLQLQGYLDDSIRILAVSDITGYPKRECNIKFKRSESHDQVTFSFVKGVSITNFHYDYKREWDHSAIKFSINGFASIPKIGITWDQEERDSYKKSFTVEWVFLDSEKKFVQVILQKGRNPVTYEVQTLTTFSAWKSASGTISTDSNSLMLRIENNATLPYIPREISLKLHGSTDSFQHSAAFSTANSSVEILFAGYIRSFYDSKVDGQVRLDSDSQYHLQFHGDSENGSRTIQLLTDLGSPKKTGFGLVLKEGNEKFGTARKELTAWDTYFTASEKKASLIIEENESSLQNFVLHIKDESNSLLKINSELVWVSWKFWSASGKIESSLELIPSMEFQSSHDMLQYTNILNINRLVFVPSTKIFWVTKGFIPRLNVSSQIVITDLSKLNGSVSWNNDNISFIGEAVENLLKFKTSGTSFSTIQGNIKHEVSMNTVDLSVEVQQDEINPLEGSIKASKSLDGLKFDGSLKIMSTPHLSCKFNLDKNNGLMEAVVGLDKEVVFDIAVQAQASPTHGLLKLASRSSLYSLLSNLVVDTLYKIKDNEVLDFEFKYSDHTMTHHIKGNGAWGMQKFFRVSLDGDFTGEMEMMIQDMKKLVTSVTFNGKKLGEAYVTYDIVPSEYSWGQHLISVSVVNHRGHSTEISLAVGLDSRKFEATLTTPFPSWSKMKVHWDIGVAAANKIIKFGIEKNKDRLDCRFDMKHIRRNDTTVVEADVNVDGFKALRNALFDEESLEFLKGLEGKFSTNIKWSPSFMEIQLKTPLPRWQDVRFSANYETKKNTLSFGATCDINDRHHELKVSTKSGVEKMEAVIYVRCLNVYRGKLELDYINPKIAFLLQGPSKKWAFNGEAKNEEITVQLTTPIKDYERIFATASYQYVNTSDHKGHLQWLLNGNPKELGYTFLKTGDACILNLVTPIQDYESVNVSATYDESLDNIKISMERADHEKMVVHVQKNVTGVLSNLTEDSSLTLTINVESPFEKYRSMILVTKYDRRNEEHVAQIQYSRNNDLLKLDGQFTYQHAVPHSVTLELNLSSSEYYMSKVQGSLSIDPNGNSSLVAAVEYNEAKHEFIAVLDVSPGRKSFDLRTTLRFLKRLHFAINSEQETTTLVHLRYEGNENVVDVQSTQQSESDRRRKFDLAVVSPFPGFRHIFLHSEYSMTENNFKASILFENEDSRWQGKIDGTLVSNNGLWSLQINTPIKAFQDITVTVKHSWTSEAKELVLFIAANAMKLVDTKIYLKQKHFSLAVETAFPLRILVKTEAEWKSLIDINIEGRVQIGDVDGHKSSSLEIKVESLMSIKLIFQSIHYPAANFKLSFKTDGNIWDGNAFTSFTGWIFDDAELRTTWKIEAWDNLELWMKFNHKHNELGGILQFSGDPSQAEYSSHAHLQWNWEGKKDHVSITASLSHHHGSTHLNVNTESTLISYQGYHIAATLAFEAELFAKLRITKNGIAVLSSENRIVITIPKSKIAMKLNAPMLRKNLEIVASYDISAENMPFELTYLDDTNSSLVFKATFVVPVDKSEVEFKVDLSSNVSNLNSKSKVGGIVKGSFRKDEEGIKHLNVVVESEKFGSWDLVTDFGWVSDLYLIVKLNNNKPDSSFKLDISWQGNRVQGISGKLMMSYKSSVVNGSFSFLQNTCHLTLTTPVEWLSDIKIDGYADLDAESKTFELKAEVDEHHYKVVGRFNFSDALIRGGSLTLFTDEEVMSALELQCDGMENIMLTGSWKEQQVKAKGSFKKLGDYKLYEMGKVNFFISVNGMEELNLESDYKLLRNEYLLNVTIGQHKSFKVSVVQNPDTSIFWTSVQWKANGRIKFVVMAQPDQVDISLTSPWASEISAQGRLVTTSIATTVEGFFIFDVEKSSFKLYMQRDIEAVHFELSLDIPALHQKLLTTFLVQYPNALVSKGSIEMDINGFKYDISGEVSNHVTQDEEIETRLALAFNFPKKIVSEVIIRKSIDQRRNGMMFNGTLTFGDETSQIHLSYKLPHTGSQSVGLSLLFNNPSCKVGFQILSACKCWKDFNAMWIYNDNMFKGGWKFGFPEFTVSANVQRAGDYYRAFPKNKNYGFTISGNVDVTKGSSLTISAECGDKNVKTHIFMKIDNDAVYSEAILNSTYFLLLEDHRYTLQIRNSKNGNYEYQLSGSTGSHNIEMTGDVSVGTRSLVANLRMMGTLGPLYGRMEYSSDNSHTVVLTLESPILITGKKVTVRADFTPVDSGFHINLQCRTRTSIHTTSLKLVVRTGKGDIGFTYKSPGFQAVDAQLLWKKDGSKLTGEIHANLDNIINEVVAFVDVENLEGHIKILSPLIPSSHFDVHLKSLFHPDDINILGDVHIREYHWRFEGALKYQGWRNFVVLFNLLTPLKTFDRLTLALKNVEDEIYVEVYTPIAAVPNAMFKISGFQAIIQKNWDEFQPEIRVGLPFGRYSVAVEYRKPDSWNSGKFRVHLQKMSDEYEIKTEISPLSSFSLNMNEIGKLSFLMITPLDDVPNIDFHLEGTVKGRSKVHISSKGKVNEDSVEMTLKYQNDNGYPTISAMLTSPFEKYENMVFSLSCDGYQNMGNGKSLHLVLENPQWMENIRLDTDFHYKYAGFLTFEGEANAALVSFMDLPPLHFSLKTDTDTGFSGVGVANIGSFPSMLQLDAHFSQGNVRLLVNATAGGDDNPYQISLKTDLSRQEGLTQFSTNFIVMDQSLLSANSIFSVEMDTTGGELDLYTPWGPVQLQATLKPLSQLFGVEEFSMQKTFSDLNVTVELQFDFQRVMGLQIVNNDQGPVIELYNPLYPINFILAARRETVSDLRVETKFCWNIEEPVGNTVGAGLIWKKRPIGGYAVIANLDMKQAGNLQIDINHSLTSSSFNQTVLLTWNNPLVKHSGQTGYQVSIVRDTISGKKETILHVHLPWRSVVLEILSDHSLSSITFKWDALRNENKNLAIKWYQEIKGGWKALEILDSIEVTHPLSVIPTTLSSDRIYRNGKFQLLEMEINTKEASQDAMSLYISRNTVDWSNAAITLKHESSNLMVAFTTKTEQNKGITASALSYLDTHGNMRNVSLNVTNNPQNLDVLLATETTNLMLLKLNRYSDLITLNYKLLSYDVDALVHTDLPFMELAVKHRGDNQMNVFYGYSHKKKVGLQVEEVCSPEPNYWIRATAELTSFNFLETKLTWNTDLWPSLSNMRFMEQIGTSLYLDLSDLGLFNEINTELERRWEQLTPEMKLTLVEVKRMVVHECKLVYEEWVKAVQFVMRLYNENTFYIKDLLGNFKFAQDALQLIWKLAAETRTAILDLLFTVTNNVRDLWSKAGGSLEIVTMRLWQRIETFVKSTWHDNLSLVLSFGKKVWRVCEAALNILEGKVAELEKKLLDVGLLRKLVQLYKGYATWLEEIPVQRFIERIEAIMNINIWDYLKEYFEPLIQAIRQGVDKKYIKEMLDIVPVNFMRYTLRTLRDGAVKIWETLAVEQRLKMIMRGALHSVDNVLHHFLPTVSYTLDFEHGIVEYNQSLSAVSWQDFTQTPTWGGTHEAQYTNQLVNFYYETLDTIEGLKPFLSLNLRKMLPPFGSHALIAGDYHYFTFDKRYFRFAGDCSYVLVTEMAPHKSDPFSFIVNYENRNGLVRKKSYSFTPNANLVEIDAADFKVTVNGRKVELPLNIGFLYIRRQQTGLEIYDERGFTVICSLTAGVCSVTVSGWHFGNLGGLLGTYDNEPINDLQGPDHHLIRDISTFAYSWRVGENSGSCRMKNFAREEPELVDVEGICYNLLKTRSSPLRPCFNTVDTTVFMEMCEYDISRNLNSANREEAACPSMSAYVTECQKNNVDVWMPPVCVRCKLEDGTALTTGENATLETYGMTPPPESSDNVIVLEEASCISSSSLYEAMRRLDVALNGEGLTNNRYAIIGYGSEGIHSQPHIKTTSSNVWAHNTLFKIPNDTSEFSAQISERATLYDAIQYSASLGFRAGVAKNFIAVTCGDENCGDPHRFADILTLLVENDIKLHLLVPKEFLLKATRKGELNQIYGMDMNGVYTAKHAKTGNLDPDSDLKRHVNVPKDFCTPLALESNGTRFNKMEFNFKKVLDVWARRVARTSHPSDCQRCECIPDRYGSASIMCHQCVSPTLWRFMEEWKTYQSLDDEEFPDLEFLDHGDFLMT